MPLRQVVVVGGSLAGLRAAEELRTRGFEGAITIVGEEVRRPYDRPPLSKQVLTGDWDEERTALPAGQGDDLGVEWRLGAPAGRLDLAGRVVELVGGARVPFDGLVIATGASPRRLPSTDHLAGVHTLRTLDDAISLRTELEAAPRRVVVVGAGFIGSEVAASCRTRGLDVTLVEALAVPLERALGTQIGQVVADLHRDHGVDVRLGVGVLGVEGAERVEKVRLTDGSVVEADVMVVGIGVTPNTGWLDGSGLVVDDGVMCDETTLAAPGVVAAGDVARWPNPRFGEVMRVEHWENAIAMGTHAARRLLEGNGAGTAFDPVPWFWSDQYDRKIQLAGRCGPMDDVEVVAGSFEERRFVVFFGRSGRLVGVLGMNMPAKVIRWRQLIEARATWEAALEEARG